MTAMTKVLIRTKGRDLKDKVMAVTRKCMELKDSFPYFWWEFTSSGGRTYFSASYRDDEGGDGFQFPIHMVEVDERYKEIRRELDELKWSALFWQKEERDG